MGMVDEKDGEFEWWRWWQHSSHYFCLLVVDQAWSHWAERKLDMPHRCIGVEWNEDVDFLRGARAERVLRQHVTQESVSNALELYAWLNRLRHKRADCKALFVVGECEVGKVELCDILYKFGRRGDEIRRLSRCTVTTNTSGAVVAQLEKLSIEVTNGVRVDVKN